MFKDLFTLMEIDSASWFDFPLKENEEGILLVRVVILSRSGVTSGDGWSANIATSISGKHSCATVVELPNNINFFGSRVLAWCTLFWQAAHICSLSVSHLQQQLQSHVCLWHMWHMAHVLPRSSCLSPHTCPALNPTLNKQSKPTPTSNSVYC